MAALGKGRGSQYNPTRTNYNNPMAYGPASAYAGGITGQPGTQDYSNSGVRISPMPRHLPQAPAAPDVAAQAGPNLSQMYEDQFKKSIAASRANIEQQLGLGLSELNQREQASKGMIGQLPGQITANYAPTAGLLNQAAATAKTAVQASLSPEQAGIAGAVGDQTVAPIQAAIAAQQGTQQSQVPLLQLGNQQLATTQRNALSQAGLSAQGQLDQEQRGYDAERANTERSNAFQLMNQTAQTQEARRASRLDFERSKILKQEDYAGQLAQENAAAQTKRPTFGRREATYERGGDLARYNQPLAENIRHSKEYRSEVRNLHQMIQKGQWNRLDSWMRSSKRGRLPRTASLALFDTNALQLAANAQTK